MRWGGAGRGEEHTKNGCAARERGAVMRGRHTGVSVVNDHKGRTVPWTQ